MKTIQIFILILFFITASCKPAVELNGDTSIEKFSFEKEPTIGSTYLFTITPDVSANSFIIQNKDSLTFGTDISKLKAKFSTINSLVKVKVNGVMQVSGVTENNFTNPVAFDAYAENGDVKRYKGIVNVSKKIVETKQYIFLNDNDVAYNYKKIKSYFGTSRGKSIAIGSSAIFYCFERPSTTLEQELKEHLRLSLEYEIPILVQFDAITFMDARPDLWNWWDTKKPGYNPDNKNNVEWTSWLSDDAVKIGWLNWGRQIRLNPMPNLFSPVYRKAVEDEMTHLITIVGQWYQQLSPDKKYLFGGIKVTGEMFFGVNNWYYPNGNSYLNQDPSLDPQTGISVNDLPSRGVQTIGYAALKTLGIKTSGNIAGNDIAEIALRHSEIVSKLCYDLGIPRDRIFSHASGVGKDLEACINQYACPAWSFYNQNAINPKGYSEALTILKTSNAPYFGIAEWSIGNSQDVNNWTETIQNGLSIPRCRYLSIYNNVIGSDLFQTSPNMAAINGIKTLHK